MLETSHLQGVPSLATWKACWWGWRDAQLAPTALGRLSWLGLTINGGWLFAGLWLVFLWPNRNMVLVFPCLNNRKANQGSFWDVSMCSSPVVKPPCYGTSVSGRVLVSTAWKWTEANGWSLFPLGRRWDFLPVYPLYTRQCMTPDPVNMSLRNSRQPLFQLQTFRPCPVKRKLCCAQLWRKGKKMTAALQEFILFHVLKEIPCLNKDFTPLPLYCHGVWARNLGCAHSLTPPASSLKKFRKESKFCVCAVYKAETHFCDYQPISQLNYGHSARNLAYALSLTLPLLSL